MLSDKNFQIPELLEVLQFIWPSQHLQRLSCCHPKGNHHPRQWSFPSWTETAQHILSLPVRGKTLAPKPQAKDLNYCPCRCTGCGCEQAQHSRAAHWVSKLWWVDCAPEPWITGWTVASLPFPGCRYYVITFCLNWSLANNLILIFAINISQVRLLMPCDRAVMF